MPRYYVVFALLAAFGAASVQATWYVDDGAPAEGDGTSWASAFNHVQDALAQADVGDLVKVAQGTYWPDRDIESPEGSGLRDATFRLSTGIVIMGGYAGFGASDPDDRDVAAYETVLSGDIGTPGDGADNTYHVVTGSNVDYSAVLDGCTIAYGHSSNEDRFGTTNGAGLLIEFGGPVVRNCTIRDNVAADADNQSYLLSAGKGGGVYCYQGSPEFTNCLVYNNSSGNGAAGYCIGYDAYAAADAGHGGGMYFSNSSTLLVNCRIFDNRTGDGRDGPSCIESYDDGSHAGSGGGVYFGSDSAGVLVNCVITGNVAGDGGNGGNSGSATGTGGDGGSGGGVASVSSSLSLTNCTITANAAGARGLGPPSGSDGAGGGIFIDDPRGSRGGALVNCIVWGNSATSGAQISGEAQVDWSCIPGVWDGSGNIAADPLLVDQRPSPGSPCIDAGSNSHFPGHVTTDCDGQPRFQDDPGTPDTGSGVPPIIDMGAYELMADCNENGVPDEVDISTQTSLDCNENGIPDECDIADGESSDVNDNGVPDECEPDCNENEVPDAWDLSIGTSSDCNGNDVPDECDIADGESGDVNDNGVPDECEPDCNENEVPDDWDISVGTSSDCNDNDVPDECETDTDGDGVIDACDDCPEDPHKTSPGGCGCGTADTDTDGDGVPDCADNCPGTFNPDQSDVDGNGLGDACDEPAPEKELPEGSCFMRCVITLMAGGDIESDDLADCNCADNLDVMLAWIDEHGGEYPAAADNLLAEATGQTDDSQQDPDTARLLAALGVCPLTSVLMLCLALAGMLLSRPHAARRR